MARRRDALAAHREALGFTQEALAQALGVELSTVGRWERGTLTPQPWRRPDLASALNLSLEELDAFLNPPRIVGDFSPATRRDVIIDAALLATAVVADRIAGKQSDCAEPIAELVSPPKTLSGASALVADVHRAYQAAHYSEAARMLPLVSTRIAALTAEGPADQQREAFSLQCSLSIAAAKLATKTGDTAGAWAAAEQARGAAETADDEFGLAAAAYQRTCALLRDGRSVEAEEAAFSAAESRRGSDPRSLTWRGALTLIGAVIAARRGDAAEAARRLNHADDLARRLGKDANIGWTAFGPSNVLIHRVSVAIALNDPYGAIATAEQMDITSLPVGLRGRQAQFHLDSSWAHAQLGEDLQAVIHLLDTERVAPELILANPNAHALIKELLGRERRRAVPGLRGLALRAGVAA